MIAGVILAAGLSSRMGRFKPLLPIGNTVFIKRLIGQMRSVGVLDIVVVTGYRKEELETAISDQAVCCVHNSRFYDSQMLDSVKIGISAVMDLGKGYDHILLSPSDVAMSPQWVFEEVIKDEADFVRPTYKEKPGHPVLIKNTLFDYILSYEGEGGLRGAVESSGLKIKEIIADDPNILLDADTREDYNRAVAEYDKLMGERGRLHGDINVELVTDQPICDERFMQLLELIEATGSLQNASKALKCSYPSLWKVIKDAEAKCSSRLIQTKAGGAGGGFSCLTDHGKDLLDRYKKMRRELDEATRRILDRHFEDFRL